MGAMTTVQQAAEQMQAHMVRSTRTDGTEYVHLDDGAPDWMRGVARAAHGDMLPDDTRYLMIETAVDALADSEDEDEARESVYSTYDAAAYADTVNWLSSYIAVRLSYADEAAREFGNPPDTYSRLIAGMMWEQNEVFDMVLAALRDHVESI